MPVVWGRRSVAEALRSGRDCEKIYLASGSRPSAVVAEIVDLARRRRIAIHYLERRALDRLADGGNHQGVVAEVGDYQYADLDDLLARASQRREPTFILALDSLQDPQNLGSLIRTAEAVGVHGIILPRHRSVGVTPAVVKSSAGAIEHVLVAQVGGLPQAIEWLKREQIWVVGLDTTASQVYHAVDYDVPLALVVGAEERGLGHLVRKRCDLLVSLPMRGEVGSLNAAVAGSIVLYHAWRQRELAQK